MVEASDDERVDVRPRDEEQPLRLRTEWCVGQDKPDGWWVYFETPGGRPFYEAGPFVTEEAAREAARTRLQQFRASRQEVLREESVPPPDMVSRR